MATGATVGAAVWWFRGWLSQERLDRLKEQISAIDQRLKLASEKLIVSERSKEELDKEFQVYKADVAAKGSSASSAKVDAAFEQFTKEDALVTHALILSRQAVQEKEARSLTVGTGYAIGTGYNNRLETIMRDLGGFGALRKLDPETLDKVKDIGRPVMGKTLNSLPNDLDKGD